MNIRKFYTGTFTVTSEQIHRVTLILRVSYQALGLGQFCVIIIWWKFHAADFRGGQENLGKEAVVSSCPTLASALLPNLGGKSAEQVCSSIPRAALTQHLRIIYFEIALHNFESEIHGLCISSV
jgi:hypothetical protein